MTNKKLIIPDNLKENWEYSDITAYLQEEDLINIEDLEDYLDRWRYLTDTEKEALVAYVNTYSNNMETAIATIEEELYTWYPDTTIEELADQYLDNFDIPSTIRPYVDLTAFGKDIALDQGLNAFDGGLFGVD